MRVRLCFFAGTHTGIDLAATDQMGINSSLLAGGCAHPRSRGFDPALHWVVRSLGALRLVPHLFGPLGSSLATAQTRVGSDWSN